MKVKEQGEGRGQKLVGILAAHVGSWQGVPGHGPRASANICCLSQTSGCPTTTTKPASAAGKCKGISEGFGPLDACPCSKPTLLTMGSMSCCCCRVLGPTAPPLARFFQYKAGAEHPPLSQELVMVASLSLAVRMRKLKKVQGDLLTPSTCFQD